jgi:adenine deaminase
MSARPPRDDGRCDLLVTNARIVDVLAGTVRAGSIAVSEGRITALAERPAREVVDLHGRAVAPGFIDAHVHIESAMTSVGEFARAVVARGTTALVADPHEIANVLGAAGLRYMLDAARGLPVRIFYTLPSCVPATELETSGARLAAADLEPFFADPAVVGLGEVMNYPGVLAGDADLLAKIAAARRAGKPVDGHAPGLSGRDLAAYVAAGVTSDHECTTRAEAREKLAAGMHVMIREGTAARNLAALLPVVDARSAARLMWCTDDRQPRDLLERGHIDSIVAAAVRAGVDPVIAIRMATLSPAERFGLHDLGAIAPGRRADFVVIPDLSAPAVEAVYVGGRRVAAKGRPASGLNPLAAPPVPPSMHAALDRVHLEVRADGPRVRVIEIVPGQIVTRAAIEQTPASRGRLVSDPARDLLKIAVIERHRASGRAGVGLVRGLGLRRGAIAMSIAHDSHNIIAAGVTDEDLRAAAAAVAAAGGGIAAAAGGRVLERLPLPIAGLMSERPVEEVAAGLGRLVRAAHGLGSPLPDPFMTLSFLALPVIPELKLTDRGLVDVRCFEHVPLFDGPRAAAH